MADGFQVYVMSDTSGGVHCANNHFLVVPEVRETLSVSQRAAQETHIDRSDLNNNNNNNNNNKQQQVAINR